MENLKPLCTVGVTEKCSSHYRKLHSNSLSDENRIIMRANNSTLMHVTKINGKRNLIRSFYIHAQRGIIHNSQKVEGTQGYSSG
jgi:hypothetical protein